MKVVKIIIPALVVFFITACDNSDNNDESTQTTPTQTTPTQTTDTGLIKKINPQVSPAPAINNTVALNPAHGQPGHRCDISVGAPLNSAPAKVNTGQPQPVIMPTAPSPAPATGGTGAKNPAHGQPGHRCDIAVGAPLN